MSKEEMPKKNGKGKIIIAVLVVLFVLGAAFGTKGSEKSKDDSSKSAAKTEDKSSSEESTEIIWKEDENMGVLNLELDGTKTKQGIIAQYYTDASSYLNGLDKDLLKEYEYIRVVGNVTKDDKIECTIKGDLTIDFIKTSDDLSPANIESNMDNLFIPKPLR